MAKLEYACENIPHMRLYFTIGRYAKIIQLLALVLVITSVRLSGFNLKSLKAINYSQVRAPSLHSLR